MKRNPNNSGAKDGTEHNRKAKFTSNIDKEWEQFKESPKMKVLRNLLRETDKKISNLKRQMMIAYMDVF